MKVAIQRVTNAKVTINGEITAKISIGLLIFVGITSYDTTQEIKKIGDKIIKLRIFNDKNNKMNLSVKDIQGELLIVSQFTLIGNTYKGNRPSFIKAGTAQHAKKIYNEFVNYMHKQSVKIQTGEFGAMMHITLTNNGPVTFILDSDDHKKN